MGGCKRINIIGGWHSESWWLSELAKLQSIGILIRITQNYFSNINTMFFLELSQETQYDLQKLYSRLSPREKEAVSPGETNPRPSPKKWSLGKGK